MFLAGNGILKKIMKVLTTYHDFVLVHQTRLCAQITLSKLFARHCKTFFHPTFGSNRISQNVEICKGRVTQLILVIINQVLAFYADIGAMSSWRIL